MDDVFIELSIQFLLSAAGIVVAGVFLAQSADQIAERTGLGRLFTGSILLAGATSLPELLVDISAIRKEMPDLAVGDLLGSSLMNLLILAVADLIHRKPAKIFSRAAAHHALSAAVSINVTAIACIAIFLGPNLAGISAGEIGLGPLSIGLFYLLALRLVYRSQPQARHAPELKAASGRQEIVRPFSVFFGAALAIFVAAPFLAAAAGGLAERTGLGTTFLGSTLVAFCTSLPEVVSTFAAVRMGAFDLAVGNIFGSNSFNMILLIPLDLVHEGNLLGAVSRTHVLTGLSVILATSVAVMGQLYDAEKRKKFVEPDAFGVIGIVIASLIILFWILPG
ncbi:MAG TPA: hypothetical protein VFV50_08430 [Bdellovibrionales bacterium]|nr:hypothetical protein [Bdellovibrionales bacterium]